MSLASRLSLRKRLGTIACLLSLGLGCAAPVQGPADGADDVALGAGKADGSAFTECELDAVVDLLNGLDVSDPTAARTALKGYGVHTTAAKCLVWYRMGADTTRSCGRSFPSDVTPSARSFEGIAQVDAVKYVGPSALRTLVDAVADRCLEGAEGTGVDVIFSPQSNYANSHAARIAGLIDTASRNVDVAMYSFSDAGIKEALIRNAGRIAIRVLYDRGHLGSGLETTLENAGIEVRYVTPIMHHKFAIIDGVHAAGDDPSATTVASGSANWSGGAVSRYDEATVFIDKSPEMALRFQREFNLLWNHSTPVPGHEEIPYVETMEITDEMVAASDDPSLDAIFTSSNFRVSSTGRLLVEKDGYDVADRWIEAIEGAERSIWLVSERIRSVPVAEALMRVAAERPEVEIRVFLDNQEYTTWSSHRDRLLTLESCYAGATTEAQRINCQKSMYYSYALAEAFEASPSHELRFKYYSYNWHHTFPQMHHKSMIVDGRMIYTGSYNLSYNAEFETFENVMVFDGADYPDLLDSFVEEAERLWRLGEEGGAYEALMGRVNGTGSEVPIQFAPISMTWDQVDEYRAAARTVCGHDQLWDLKQNDETARYCTRR